MPGCASYRTVWPNEFGLPPGKAHYLSPHGPVVKPRRARVGPDDRNAIGVLEELPQPGHVAVPASEWGVHEDQPLPRLRQTVVGDSVNLTRRHPVARTGRAWIEIKFET